MAQWLAARWRQVNDDLWLYYLVCATERRSGLWTPLGGKAFSSGIGSRLLGVLRYDRIAKV